MSITLAEQLLYFSGGVVFGFFLRRLAALLIRTRRPRYVSHTVNCPFSWEEKGR